MTIFFNLRYIPKCINLNFAEGLLFPYYKTNKKRDSIDQCSLHHNNCSTLDDFTDNALRLLRNVNYTRNYWFL